MVKYLKVTNKTFLENLIYKMKPNHISIEIKELEEWMEKAVNNYQMNAEEFQKTTFNQKLSFKGLVKYHDYFTTANGVLIDVENKKYIQLSNFFDLTVDIFEIIPQLKKLEKLGEFQLDSLYDYYFIDKNKKFPDFTDEEWEEFIEKAISKNALVWTEDLDEEDERSCEPNTLNPQMKEKSDEFCDTVFNRIMDIIDVDTNRDNKVNLAKTIHKYLQSVFDNINTNLVMKA